MADTYSKHVVDMNLLTSHDKPEIWNNYCALGLQRRSRGSNVAGGRAGTEPPQSLLFPTAGSREETRKRQGAGGGAQHIRGHPVPSHLPFPLVIAPDLTEEETEFQRGGVTCPKFTSSAAALSV